MQERAKELNDANRDWPFLDPPNTAVIGSVRQDAHIQFLADPGLVGLAACETPPGSRAAAVLRLRIEYRLIFPHVARRY